MYQYEAAVIGSHASRRCPSADQAHVKVFEQGDADVSSCLTSGRKGYQDASRGGLAGDELSGPVFGVGDERALELLLGLPRRLGQLGLLLLQVALAVLRRGVFAAAHDR